PVSAFPLFNAKSSVIAAVSRERSLQTPRNHHARTHRTRKRHPRAAADASTSQCAESRTGACAASSRASRSRRWRAEAGDRRQLRHLFRGPGCAISTDARPRCHARVLARILRTLRRAVTFADPDRGGDHRPGGAVLALFCDYRVMARGAYRIGLNEVQVGLTVPDCIQAALRRLVGPYRAERLLIQGTMLDADDALAAGMVDELTDVDHV